LAFELLPLNSSSRASGARAFRRTSHAGHMSEPACRRSRARTRMRFSSSSWLTPTASSASTIVAAREVGRWVRTIRATKVLVDECEAILRYTGRSRCIWGPSLQRRPYLKRARARTGPGSIGANDPWSGQ
jgi:hypothetical protein